MKKVFLYLIILVFTIGCDGLSNRTSETINWIGKAKKPITVTLHGANLYGDNNYTLTDSNGLIYVTGFVNITLPKIINKIIK